MEKIIFKDINHIRSANEVLKYYGYKFEHLTEQEFYSLQKIKPCLCRFYRNGDTVLYFEEWTDGFEGIILSDYTEEFKKMRGGGR